MTIDEAIKILERQLIGVEPKQFTQHEKADGLGIEALKRISSGRNPERRYVCYLLPGETEE